MRALHEDWKRRIAAMARDVDEYERQLDAIEQRAKAPRKPAKQAKPAHYVSWWWRVR